LAWFLYENLQQFGDLAQSRGDDEFARTCASQAEELRANIEEHAWDGGWYRRAYFDNGTPLGSSTNEECRIDSISQSWAVLSGAGEPQRAIEAMAAVDTLLVKRDAGLIKLLDPPFDRSSLEPGYIKGYVPGVRENGGQYTHAAIWAAMAFAQLGDTERAWELFSMLSPIHHGSQAADADLYKVEPYVMSADVYGASPHTGRGGWTWYTGAAGWMYRLAVETLLGLRLEVDKLRLAPLIPQGWESFKIHYRYRETFYHITVRRVGERREANGTEPVEPKLVALDPVGRNPIGLSPVGPETAGAGSAGTESLIRVAIDGVRPKEAGPLPGTILLVDDHRDHYVDVELDER
jgi:cellobiose phosphorylase